MSSLCQSQQCADLGHKFWTPFGTGPIFVIALKGAVTMASLR